MTYSTVGGSGCCYKTPKTVQNYCWRTGYLENPVFWMSTFYINPASACQNTKSGFFQPPFRHGSTRIDLASPICIQTRRCATHINLDKIPHMFKAVLEFVHILLTPFMRFQNHCLTCFRGCPSTLVTSRAYISKTKRPTSLKRGPKMNYFFLLFRMALAVCF